jgi:excisionase family DNA binding protein
MRTRIVEQEVIDDKDPLLTPDEVCERLNVTRRWIRRAIENDYFPVVKIGGFNRFPESGVEAYIEANTQPAKQS